MREDTLLDEIAKWGGGGVCALGPERRAEEVLQQHPYIYI
jgi:hypothetical protein